MTTPPNPSNPDPRRIDRAALDKIIQRAAELQTSERDIGEGLTRAEVLELGKDVGIPAKYLQQAILEQGSTSSGSEERGFLARVVGPREVTAQRVVQGEPEDVSRALVQWMERNELVVLQRLQPGRLTWEPLRGMQAAIRRGTASLDTSKPKFMLSRSELVAATIAPLEAGYSHVQLSATLKEARMAAVGGGFAGVTLGGAAAIVLGVMSPFVIVAVPPLLIGGALGWFGVRRYRPVVERVQLGLERALDFLEAGGVKPAHQLSSRPPGLLEVLASEVRKAISSSSDRPKNR
ncbi:MAG: hypothetical protein ABI647_00790 [Gemmatimonadota bacterium]